MSIMKNVWDKFWFRCAVLLLASVYITEMGSVAPLATRLFTADFYKEYVATVVIGFVVLEGVYSTNRFLDAKKPWDEEWITRLVLQFTFGLLIPILLVIGLASLYFYVNGINILLTDYLYYALPFVAMLLLLMNVVLVMTPYCLVGWRHFREGAYGNTVDMAEARTAASDPTPSVKALSGAETLLLEHGVILAAYIIDGNVLVREKSGDELLSESTLDELESSLNSADFFRINRQLIMHRSLCKGYKPLDHGKLEVTTEVVIPVPAIVSQLKAKAFRAWMESEGVW